MEYICLNCGQINDSLNCPTCGCSTTKEEYNSIMKQANDAIRYGYFYRKIAEEATKNENIRYHFCITNPSDFIEWIASLVISGVSFDLIKLFVKNIYSFVKSKFNNPDKKQEKIIEILENEEELRLFVRYTREFHAGLKGVDSKIVKYIQEEINADFSGKVAGRIWEEEHRIPNAQDFLKIMKEEDFSDIEIHYREELNLFDFFKKKSIELKSK